MSPVRAGMRAGSCMCLVRSGLFASHGRLLEEAELGQVRLYFFYMRIAAVARATSEPQSVLTARPLNLGFRLPHVGPRARPASLAPIAALTDIGREPAAAPGGTGAGAALSASASPSPPAPARGPLFWRLRRTTLSLPPEVGTGSSFFTSGLEGGGGGVDRSRLSN